MPDWLSYVSIVCITTGCNYGILKLVMFFFPSLFHKDCPTSSPMDLNGNTRTHFEAQIDSKLLKVKLKYFSKTAAFATSTSHVLDKLIDNKITHKDATGIIISLYDFYCSSCSDSPKFAAAPGAPAPKGITYHSIEHEEEEEDKSSSASHTPHLKSTSASTARATTPQFKDTTSSLISWTTVGSSVRKGQSDPMDPRFWATYAVPVEDLDL